jgi:hypothetical protein
MILRHILRVAFDYLTTEFLTWLFDLLRSIVFMF